MNSITAENGSKQIPYDEEEVERLVEKNEKIDQSQGQLIQPFPLDKEEEKISDFARIKQLGSLSGPILAESLFYLLWQIITLIFLNQTTKVTVYAALGLSFLWLDMTSFVVVGGFRDVIVSTCSHEYGKGNLRQVGVVFHKGLVVYWTFAAIMLLISTQIEYIFLRAGQDPVVSSMVSDSILYFSLAMFPLGFHVALMAFLQAQQIVIPQNIATFVSLLAHPLWCYIFIIHLDWELKGAALAYITSNMLASVLTYLLVVIPGLCKESLILPKSDSFKNYKEFLVLGAQNALTLGLQWWIPQIGTFMVGLLGQIQLAAQTCLFQVQLILVIIPDSLQLAGVSLAAYYAAQGKKKEFVHVSKLTIVMGLVIMLFIIVTLFLLRHPFALALNKDPDVSALIADLFPFVFAYVFLEGFHYLISIFLQAVGIYGPAVVFIGINYYLIGLPCAYILGFVYEKGIFGIWSGFIIGAIGECVCFTIYILLLNLDDEIAKIQNAENTIEPPE